MSAPIHASSVSDRADRLFTQVFSIMHPTAYGPSPNEDEASEQLYAYLWHNSWGGLYTINGPALSGNLDGQPLKLPYVDQQFGSMLALESVVLIQMYVHHELTMLTRAPTLNTPGGIPQLDKDQIRSRMDWDLKDWLSTNKWYYMAEMDLLPSPPVITGELTLYLARRNRETLKHIGWNVEDISNWATFMQQEIDE